MPTRFPNRCRVRLMVCSRRNHLNSRQRRKLLASLLVDIGDSDGCTQHRKASHHITTYLPETLNRVAQAVEMTGSEPLLRTGKEPPDDAPCGER